MNNMMFHILSGVCVVICQQICYQAKCWNIIAICFQFFILVSALFKLCWASHLAIHSNENQKKNCYMTTRATCRLPVWSNSYTKDHSEYSDFLHESLRGFNEIKHGSSGRRKPWESLSNKEYSCLNQSSQDYKSRRALQINHPLSHMQNKPGGVWWLRM